jgi:phosphoglycolate phosphatase
MKTIIWDWNGTLFDDVDICIQSMNVILGRYKIKKLETREEYRSKFCFPVESYYQNIGFDFSKVTFDQLAKEFMDVYQPASLNCCLTTEAETILAELKEKKVHQIIISASKTENLKEQVNALGISQYFDCILGINDHLAKTKIDIAENWVRESNSISSDMTIIGDTMHDYEVSRELKCQCIL